MPTRRPALDSASKVGLLCIGTSHRLVPVRTLERVMPEADAIRSAFVAATQNDPSFPFSELTLLATCNRVEFYVVCTPAQLEHAESFLSAIFARPEELVPCYVHRDGEALRHLCRVTAGLDSMVPGEPQIAGQVQRAFAETVHRDSASVLIAAAMHARRINRRARTETGIARRPASVSSVAVQLAAEQTGGLAGKRVLVLGAGKMGRVTCEVLRAARAHLTVANRTLEHAEELARRVDAVAAPLSPLPHLLAAADVVIASTAAPRVLIDRAVTEQALQLRHAAGDRSRMLLIDIAVPCNVAEDVGDIPDVQLIGIDDLRTRVASHLEERRREIPHVDAIIDRELALLESDALQPLSV